MQCFRIAFVFYHATFPHLPTDFNRVDEMTKVDIIDSRACLRAAFNLIHALLRQQQMRRSQGGLTLVEWGTGPSLRQCEISVHIRNYWKMMSERTVLKHHCTLVNRK